VKSRTHFLIAFCSAMAVTLVAVSDMGRTSPGTLATVHLREPDLAGRNDCSACHGGLFEDMRAACLECHADIGAQLEGASGLHGTLEARAEQCGLCHSEHHGAAAPLVQRQSFALAGTNKVEDFDHASIGWVMDGAHLELQCRECHANADVAVLQKGAKRYLGLERDCASCHEDVHEGRFTASCASCHGQSTWDGLHSEGHERFLALVGGHGGLDCRECHGESDAHALEIVGGAGTRPAARACVDCHDSPHRAPFVAGVAEQVGQAPGQACLTCHAAEHDTFHHVELLRMTPAQHAASGFALAEPHDQVKCVDCHALEPRDFAARYPGRSADRCSACHEDVHAGQFATGPFSQGDCLACHERTHFDPPAFDVEEHARAALPLEGAHLELECSACHERASAAEARVFHGTPSDCEGCHRDVHDGAFEPFVTALAPVEHGECARCHDAERFAHAEQGFDHERFTGFAIAGAHAQSECQACHPAAEAADEDGRRFGRVREHFGAFQGCVTCHADPHAGRFDDPGLPARVEGRADCARCHVESSFRAMARPFDHGFWTDFYLYDEHQTACSACHRPLPGRDERGRTLALADGAGCGDCHEDPHGGQFAEEGAADCQRCHDDEYQDFLAFDHERDARFALGEAHAGLECAACHASERREGLALVRYRPLGIECADCHGTHAEVLLRKKPRR